MSEPSRRTAGVLGLVVVALAAVVAWRVLSRDPSAASPSPAKPASETLESKRPTAAAVDASPSRAVATAERAPIASTAPTASTAAAPDPDRWLQGVVVDAAGAPASGAAVELLRRAAAGFTFTDPDEYNGETRISETRSDDVGSWRFSVRPGLRYDVRAWTEDHQSALARDHRGGDRVELKLARVASLRGRVTRAADGAPVADALVTLSNGVLFVRPQETRTNASGDYCFEGIEGGKWYLGVASSCGHPRDDVTLELASGEEREQDLQVGAGTLVRGRVTDASTGAPIAGAEISGDPYFRFTVKTGADGRYEWPGTRERSVYLLSVRAAGYGRNEAPRRKPVNGELVQDFALTRARRAHGRVVDGRGLPVADAALFALALDFGASGQKLDVRSTRTNGEGRYELADLRSDLAHFLLVRADGFGTRSLAFPPEESERDALDLPDVELAPAGVVLAHLVDENGVSLAGASLVLSGIEADWSRWSGPPQTADAASPGATSHLFSDRHATTDREGRAGFGDLAAGTYRLTESRPGASSSAEQTIEITAGSSIVAELARTNALEISGVLRVARRGARFRAFVSAIPADAIAATKKDGADVAPLLGRATARAEVRQDGSFRLDVPAGRYRLHVEPLNGDRREEGAVVHLPLDRDGVSAGSNDLELTLAEGILLRGKLLDAAHVPVARARVVATGADGGLLAADETSTDGAFALPVPPDTGVEVCVWRDPSRAAESSPAPHGAVAPTGADLVTHDVHAEDGDLELVLREH